MFKSLNKIIDRDESFIKEIKKDFETKERRFFHGRKRYMADSLYCYAIPGTLETSILKLKGSVDNNNKRLLNLGGGTGQVSKILSASGFDVYNVDIMVKEENERNKFYDLNSGEKFPYEEGSFDFVLCQEVIEHIENPWNVMRLCAKALKKEGKLVVTTPNVVSQKSKSIFKKTNYLHWFMPKNLKYHINPMPFWELEMIAEKTGFKVIELRGNSEYFFSKNKNLKKEEILKKCECLIYLLEKK